MTRIAKRYAAALFALAEEQGALDAVARDVEAIGAALAESAAKALLTSPDVGADERERVLQKLGEGRHQLVQNLFGVLRHRRRLEVLPDLPAAFLELVMAARGEVAGVAESAHPLGDAELDALSTLAGRLSGKQVLLTGAHRPELIGGKP